MPTDISENAKAFLEMSPEEIVRLQRKISACLLAQEEENNKRWESDTVGENVGEFLGGMMCARIRKREDSEVTDDSKDHEGGSGTETTTLKKEASVQTQKLTIKGRQLLEGSLQESSANILNKTTDKS